MTPTPPEKPKRTVLLKADHVESFSNEYFSSESDEDEVPIITHIDKTTSISVKGSLTFRLQWGTRSFRHKNAKKV